MIVDRKFHSMLTMKRGSPNIMDFWGNCRDKPGILRGDHCGMNMTKENGSSLADERVSRIFAPHFQ
jgi:hypothetical protein